MNKEGDMFRIFMVIAIVIAGGIIIGILMAGGEDK